MQTEFPQLLAPLDWTLIIEEIEESPGDLLRNCQNLLNHPEGTGELLIFNDDAAVKGTSVPFKRVVSLESYPEIFIESTANVNYIDVCPTNGVISQTGPLNIILNAFYDGDELVIAIEVYWNVIEN